ncbi:MAG: translation initiation factor [Candidatus Parcubacteria bacterium]|jgi:translation initiation factor IF-3
MRIHYKRRVPQRPAAALYRTNQQIRVPDVRVVDENGEPLGVLRIEAALAMAQERGYDLVEVSPKAEPPVCRLLDYGQFKYQKEKEMRAKKVHAHKVEVKGIRLSVKMGKHDEDIRLQKAKEFLEEGHKIKIEIMLRGREKAHGDLAKQRIETFVASLQQTYPLYLDQPVQRQASNYSAIVGRK